MSLIENKSLPFLRVFFFLVGGLLSSQGYAASKKTSSPGKKGDIHKKKDAARAVPPVKRKPSSQGVTKLEKVALPSLPAYGTAPIQLSSLLKKVTRRNPTLARMRRLVSVFRQKEKQAGAWPDLQVGIQANNFPLPTFNPTITPMTGIQYTVSQRFPILKRLGLEKKLTRFTTAMLKEDVREKTVWIHLSVKVAVLWLAYFREALNTEKELYNVTGQAAEVARIKYSVGKATRQNYLQAWTLQSLIRNRMLTLLSQERVKRHQLARLLGSSSGLSGQAPVLLDPAAPPTRKAIYKQASKERGIVKRWRISAKQSRTLLSFARIRYWPDVSVQLGIRQRFPNTVDKGLPFLTLGVKVALPTWGNAARYGLVKEAMARHQLAVSRLLEAQTRIRESIRIATTQMRQYDRQIVIYRRQVIPLAFQTYRSALSSYQVDRIDFLTLLTNLRTLYKEKLKLVKLRTLRAIAIARLSAIAGGSL